MLAAKHFHQVHIDFAILYFVQKKLFCSLFLFWAQLSPIGKHFSCSQQTSLHISDFFFFYVLLSPHGAHCNHLAFAIVQQVTDSPVCRTPFLSFPSNTARCDRSMMMATFDDAKTLFSIKATAFYFLSKILRCRHVGTIYVWCLFSPSILHQIRGFLAFSLFDIAVDAVSSILYLAEDIFVPEHTIDWHCLLLSTERDAHI